MKQVERIHQIATRASIKYHEAKKTHMRNIVPLAHGTPRATGSDSLHVKFFRFMVVERFSAVVTIRLIRSTCFIGRAKWAGEKTLSAARRAPG